MSDNARTTAPDPVEAMLAQASLKTTLFAPNSRYYGIDTTVITRDGTMIPYLRRRFVPGAGRFPGAAGSIP